MIVRNGPPGVCAGRVGWTARCETSGMDMGRESRWEKDAMTVEIVFALVTAAVLAAAVFAVALALSLVLGLSAAASEGVRTAGALVGAAAGAVRLVRVLYRFDAERRKGH
ncbi:hypothetical protein F610DRAFT_02719 [Streptomyces sp. LaPpAH-199]|nr:hypothetical protein F610DRAFT_02719 [Streptomyces sp. LaPpAH-199]